MTCKCAFQEEQDAAYVQVTEVAAQIAAYSLFQQKIGLLAKITKDVIQVNPTGKDLTQAEGAIAVLDQLHSYTHGTLESLLKKAESVRDLYLQAEENHRQAHQEEVK